MTTLIFIAGLAAIAAGAGLIYLPAGLIVGGALVAWVTYAATAAPVDDGEAAG